MMPDNRSTLRRILDRVFPPVPDFFALLADQCLHVGTTVNRMVEYMESGDPEVGEMIRKDEHEADAVKVRNIHILNEAFSTPIDREDIYRSIMDLDEIINYCKSTVNEMEALALKPDKHTLEFSMRLKEGVDALVAGFSKLKSNPRGAELDANTTRKAERAVERIYRRAIADLFQGTDFIDMFKRREIYRHMSNAADRMAHCANTLHDIVVKIS
ncbi:MAG: DUF47 family protein [Rhodospirillaceae bacterium]|nr:DUF47 family protein [Rhodospirillaceae bacterium]